jgi:surfactin synthase thioesterase subunit
LTSQIEQETTTGGSWFQPVDPATEGRIRLFLFPHAGSGAIIYRNWGDLLPADITQQAVTLPGRHDRRHEPSYDCWEPLLDALTDVMLAELDDRPYALFGHCLGAQLAYRLTVRLAEEGVPAPLLVGGSGWAPEGFFRPTEEQCHMPEPEMIEWIKKLGSFPADVYDNPEMLALVLPALRADLAVCAEYEDDGAPVSCPVVSYGGRTDPLMEDPNAMDSWATRTPNYLGNNEFPGGHFFIDHYAQAVTSDFAGHVHRLEAAE